MQSLFLHTRVGKDGILKLETLVDMTDTELDIVLTFHPTSGKENIEGWPSGFFERTFGSVPDFPDRAPQGKYEIRNGLE